MGYGDSLCRSALILIIDGPSGAGKTSLAAAVAARLSAPIVHMDSLYPGWDGLAEGVHRLTALVLEPLARGEAPRWRPWDWHGDRWGDPVELGWTSRLVVEGCGSSASPAGELAALRVWMDAPTRLRRRRGIDRDGQTYSPHWERWAAQEQTLFDRDRTRDRAHLVLDTG